MRIIQEELQGIALEWNTHRMRPCNSNYDTPPGIPDEIYFLSESNGVLFIHDTIVHKKLYITCRHPKLS